MRKINIKNVVVIVVALAGLFMLNGLIVNNSKPVQASVRNAKSVKKNQVLSRKNNVLFTVKVNIGGHAVLHIVPSFRVDSIIETKNGGTFKVYQVITIAGQTWYKVGKKRWVPSRDTNKPMKDGKMFTVQTYTYSDTPDKVYRTFDGFTYVYQIDNDKQRYEVTGIFG